MKIFYIFHSSFVVETTNKVIIFDFYKFPNQNINNNLYTKEYEDFFENYIRKKDKKIFIFSSHSHSDHFNQEILSWDKENKNITYIFSDDIKKYISESQEKSKKIFYVKEDDKIKIEDLKISVYGSTDLGVSFYINIDEKNIFHSGDFHLWHWEDDTLTEEQEMKDKYLAIINKIKNDEIKENKKIDFAFVPVDPRLGTNTFEGVEIFNEIINPKYIIPMHFENNFSAMNNFLNIIGEDKGIRIEKNMTKIWS